MIECISYICHTNNYGAKAQVIHKCDCSKYLPCTWRGYTFFLPLHSFPVPSYPLLHSHLNDPIVSVHLACTEHGGGDRLHSLISETETQPILLDRKYDQIATK